MRPTVYFAAQVKADSPGNEYEIDHCCFPTFGEAVAFLRERVIGPEGRFGEILLIAEDRPRDEAGRYTGGGRQTRVIKSMGCLMPDGTDTFVVDSPSEPPPKPVRLATGKGKLGTLFPE